MVAESEVFGWNRGRIPNDTRSRSRCRSRIFLSDSDSRSPIGWFLHHTPKLWIPVDMLQFLMKHLLKQRILAVHHDFHWVLVATKILTAKLHPHSAQESGVGVGHFTSESATLLGTRKNSNWMNANKFTVNYTKHKFILFSKISPLTSSISLSCGGLTIEQVERIKYLGVLMDSRLNWDPTF